MYNSYQPGYGLGYSRLNLHTSVAPVAYAQPVVSHHVQPVSYVQPQVVVPAPVRYYSPPRFIGHVHHPFGWFPGRPLSPPK